MASADQLRSLARNVARQDFERSRDVLEKIADYVEERGQARLAEDIHSIMAAVQRQRESSLKIRGGAVQHDERASGWITDVDVSHVSLRSLVLSAAQRSAIRAVLDEQAHARKLRHHNLEPTRRLLLAGPAGTGKSLTAAVLAAELEVPLRRIDMHSIVSRYLGETARNIAQVFEEVQLVRAVYLFDEFDSISRSRYNAQDSGEMDRVVNAVLQLIENDSSQSILVATSNAAEHIDVAFARRFDEVVAYGLPDDKAIESLIRLYIPAQADAFDRAISLFRGLSHADVANTLNRIHKDIILNGTRLTQQAIRQHVERYRSSRQLIGSWTTSSSSEKDSH